MEQKKDPLERLLTRVWKPKLGQILIQSRAITPTQLGTALEFQSRSKKKLGQILIEKRFVSEDELARGLASQYDLEFINPDDIDLNRESVSEIFHDFIIEKVFIPIEEDEKVLIITWDPSDLQLIDFVRNTTGKEVVIKVANLRSLTRKIKSIFPEFQIKAFQMESDQETAELEIFEEEEEEETQPGESFERDNPVVSLVNQVIALAIRKKASDIHFEPAEKDIRVKFRVDGILIDGVPPLQRELIRGIVARLKILGELNIAETRIPQDGRFRLKIMNKPVDFRLSTLPSIHGESCVIRILKGGDSTASVESLGLGEKDLKNLRSNIHKPYGLVLVTGPTGSGKTTLLYSCINEVFDYGKKIITIEDPVEYEFKGIIQVPINVKKGLNFDNGLRSIVRQDPDIVVVGEIRDSITATIAINAALTGHLVLSTYHANNTVDTIGRMVEMGLKPSQFATSMNLVIAQRLLRKLCPDCKQKQPLTEQLRSIFKSKTDGVELIYTKKGCKTCQGTGYFGRQPILEMLCLTEELQQTIISGASLITIRKMAEEQGLTSLRKSAEKRVIEGSTTIDEMNRVTF